MRGQFPGFGIFGQYCSANRTGNVTFAKLVIQLGYLYFVGRAFFCDTGIAALKRRDLCFQLFFQNGNLGVNIIYLFLGGGIFLQQVFCAFSFIFGFADLFFCGSYLFIDVRAFAGYRFTAGQ